jgi:hypothetical protein
VLNNGWRIGLEYTVNASLSITGEMISDDGFAGAQLVKLDYLPTGVSALVNYTPPRSEVIKSDTPLTAEESAILVSLFEANFNRRKHDPDTNTVTIYEEDKVTPKHVFDTNADLSDITPRP